MAGRKKDNIWIHFSVEATTPGKKAKAKCKTCGKVLMGLVARLKDHVKKCTPEEGDTEDFVNQPLSLPSSSTNNSIVENNAECLNLNMFQAARSTKRKAAKMEGGALKESMNSYVVKTNKCQKQYLDETIAKYMYATNSAFHHVQHPKFQEMVSALRPGYTAPNEVEIGGVLLDTVYKQEKEKCSDYFKGQTVNLSVDGWSNVHNEPILCAVATNHRGESFLVETIDTSGHQQTSEYLAEVSKNAIRKCEMEFKCAVRSLVTDNAANVNGMRTVMENDKELNVLTYGCSAHLLNLLAQDVNIPDVKEQIVYIVKYFRNTHFANAKYREAGGLKLILPQEVRWNTMADCLSAYIKNWPVIVKVCEENRTEIEPIVYQKVTNFGIKRNGEDLLKRLKPIAVALDRMQRKDCTIATAVHFWKKLETDLKEQNLGQKCMKSFFVRYNQALGSLHFLAYLLDPRYAGINLTANEKTKAFVFAKEKYSASVMPIVLKFQAKAEPFHEFLFEEKIMENVTPIDWWKAQLAGIGNSNVELEMVTQLFSAIATSASVERVFSMFGLVQSKLRNCLGTEKAGKLVFLFKHFNNQTKTKL